ncbi:hypothetical protein CBOM_06036 [Ceraceosorus bombacis]|uniref:Uncharacterized protein n=1 Tax=Ceraceosorus bombacis TaxID=401625 RepID=A0A0N7LAC1_9BASI|nr:hypothetical protein CBOM_06036 [Ceraceosorus bombacis]
MSAQKLVSCLLILMLAHGACALPPRIDSTLDRVRRVTFSGEPDIYGASLGRLSRNSSTRSSRSSGSSSSFDSFGSSSTIDLPVAPAPLGHARWSLSSPHPLYHETAAENESLHKNSAAHEYVTSWYGRTDASLRAAHKVIHPHTKWRFVAPHTDALGVARGAKLELYRVNGKAPRVPVVHDLEMENRVFLPYKKGKLLAQIDIPPGAVTPRMGVYHVKKTPMHKKGLDKRPTRAQAQKYINKLSEADRDKLYIHHADAAAHA